MLNVRNNDVFIYDIIGPSEMGYISANDFIDAISPMEGKDINVRIMSAGGSVDQGVAIYNAIKRRRGKTTVYVDSIAASIASVIAMGGDQIIMTRGSKLMIHEPWTLSAGNSSALRKLADLLDKYGESILDIYKEKTNLPEDKIKDMMRDETWMTAREAIELGFADSMEGEAVAQPAVPKNMFNNVPSDVAQVEIKSKKRLDQLTIAMRIRDIHFAQNQFDK